jgi:hypothetical protein
MRAVPVLVLGGAVLLLAGCTGSRPDPAPFGEVPTPVTAIQADQVAPATDDIVSGQVTEPGGGPVVGLTITARARSATPGCLRCGRTTTRTAQDGTFTFSLPAGDYFFCCVGICRPADGSTSGVVRLERADTEVALLLVPPRHSHPR